MIPFLRLASSNKRQSRAGLVLRRQMVYSSKDSNHVDFCRDSAKYASIMAFAAPKVENPLIKAIMQGISDYERSALLACCHRIQKSRPVGMKSTRHLRQAQCHGRNAISWTEKFKLDVWYVDHVSLMTDLKVIWITIMKVLKRDGISQEGNATMEAFNGKN